MAATMSMPPKQRCIMTKTSSATAAFLTSIRDSDCAIVRKAEKASDQVDEILLVSGSREQRVCYSSQLVTSLCQQGLLVSCSDGRLGLTAEAHAWLVRRQAAQRGADGYRAQHGSSRCIKVPVTPKRHCAITIVDSESPLAWLARRKNKKGEPFLAAALVQAGERLREDFTRGCMGQNITMNWNADRISFSNGARSNGSADIGDNALDARERVARAMDAVGPELACALIDVCCYLKSITDVEKSRQWPARSGKLILKMGLQALARHYGLVHHVPSSVLSSKSRHLGAADYRPNL